MFIYSAYSLNILSDVTLPGYSQESNAGASVTIRKTLRDTALIPPSARKEVAASRTKNGLEFVFPFGSKYVVSEGKVITIVSNRDADPRLEILALQGVIFAALMSQRGMMVLHASAIELGGKGIVVIGDKGQGKTTLGLKLLSSGGRLLSDDVTALSFEQGRAMIHPGPPVIKAWPDALGYVGVDPHCCPKLFDETDKRLYCVPDSQTSATPVELSRLFFLQDAEVMRLRKMGGPEKMMYLGASVYLSRFQDLRSEEEIGRDFDFSALLAQRCNAYMIERPHRLDFLEETCREILNSC